MLHQNDPELKRREMLWRQKHELVIAADKETREHQFNISKDVTGHFEKLAVFCGGTIALVVSFLGAHKDTLHWHRLIPISIWILAGGMIAATIRNVLYQHWAHRVFERSSVLARREEQEARAEYLSVAPNPIAIQTGERLDAKFLSNMQKANKELDEILNKWESKEKFILTCWIWAGFIAQALGLIGVLCLVVLATKNV